MQTNVWPINSKCPTKSKKVFTNVLYGVCPLPSAGSFKESDEDPVVLHSVSAVGLKVLLESIYTSKLNLNMENVQHVLPVAHLFQVIYTKYGKYTLPNLSPLEMESKKLNKKLMLEFQVGQC